MLRWPSGVAGCHFPRIVGMRDTQGKIDALGFRLEELCAMQIIFRQAGIDFDNVWLADNSEHGIGGDHG